MRELAQLGRDDLAQRPDAAQPGIGDAGRAAMLQQRHQVRREGHQVAGILALQPLGLLVDRGVDVQRGGRAGLEGHADMAGPVVGDDPVRIVEGRRFHRILRAFQVLDGAQLEREIAAMPVLIAQRERAEQQLRARVAEHLDRRAGRPRGPHHEALAVPLRRLPAVQRRIGPLDVLPGQWRQPRPQCRRCRSVRSPADGRQPFLVERHGPPGVGHQGSELRKLALGHRLGRQPFAALQLIELGDQRGRPVGRQRRPLRQRVGGADRRRSAGGRIRHRRQGGLRRSCLNLPRRRARHRRCPPRSAATRA